MSSFWKPGAARPASALDRGDGGVVVTARSPSGGGGGGSSSSGSGSGSAALPVASAKASVLYALERHAALVLVGETGSGKTTQVPQYLLDAGWARDGRKIVCTQPRRVAATAIAAHVAGERHGHVGDEVGYVVRFETCTHPTRTRLTYTTPGLLFRECLRDPLLSSYSVVMVDEAHERSAYSDLLVAVLKKIQRQRADLRIILASATLDAGVLASYLGAPVLCVPGRTYPVDVAYAAHPIDDVLRACIDAVWHIHTHHAGGGDILVFVPGRDDIEQVMQALADKHDARLHILPLYAALPAAEQRMVLDAAPLGKRKVVVATNVAETSITIDGITHVVDSGFTKTRYLDMRVGMDVLTTVRISQASARQRAGRAGRTQPGHCVRLYTEAQFHSMRASDAPELVQCDIAPYVLQLLALGVENVARFDFVPPAPPAAHVARALTHLAGLEAVDGVGRLTPLGERLAEAPLSPMMTRALLHAARHGCADDILTIAAMTCVASPFLHGEAPDSATELYRRPFSAEEGDFLTLLNVYTAFADAQHSARWAKQHGLEYATLRRAMAIRTQLAKYATLHWSLPLRSTRDSTLLRRCITAGFFPHAARYVGGAYENVHGLRLHVHPSSVLFTRIPTSSWVVYGDVVWTTQPQMRDVCTIDEAWLIDAAPHFYTHARTT